MTCFYYWDLVALWCRYLKLKIKDVVVNIEICMCHGKLHENQVHLVLLNSLPAAFARKTTSVSSFICGIEHRIFQTWSVISKYKILNQWLNQIMLKLSKHYTCCCLHFIIWKIPENISQDKLLTHLEGLWKDSCKFKWNLPLKFGRILASYPDVLPINLSKKSEGDRVCEGCFPDLESWSLQKLVLNIPLTLLEAIPFLYPQN